ncbi:MAG TPA: extracellular solute-binding protein [Candidatus Thermoplasmatota archaeon]|nr:extracellular solute-binding protein [Candidatus Thermoplasmatota archaeon]
MAGTSAAGCGTSPAPGARGGSGRPGSFDWRNFAGQTIRVMDKFGPSNEFYATQVPAFENLTGMKVEYEMVRDQDVRNKMVVLFSAGETSVDVFNSTVVQDGVRYLTAGWYAPLDPFIRDRALTAPGFDLQDFLEGPLASAKVQPQNVLVGLPQDAEPSLLYFNKSLFDRNGVPHPKGPAWKWKDLEENLLRLHRPDQGVSGLLMRNDAAGGIAHWSIYLHDRGGTWFDRDNKVSVSTPLALEAFEDYARILRRVGPPELQQGSGLSVLGEFQAGKVATILEQSAFAPQLLDTSKSAVADFVGYAAVPSGPKGAAPLVFSWISAVSNLSKKKEAAWLWVQWHTGKEVALRLGVEAGLPPSRKSAWDHPDFRARAKSPDLNRVVLESLKQPLGHGDWLPPVVNVGEARPIAGRPIVVAIQGGDFKAAAREATAQLQQL